MKLLLDTHIFLWAAKAPERLTAAEHGLLARREVRPIVSSVTIWELRIKWNSFHPSGDRKGEFDPAEAIEYARRDGIELAALQPEDCAVILVSPVRLGDPFDEMLLVHAQQLGARLLTRDRLLLEHPLAWRFA
ncbi:MAG: PIN domain-containing protein [Sphingomonas sp.]